MWTKNNLNDFSEQQNLTFKRAKIANKIKTVKVVRPNRHKLDVADKLYDEK